MSIQLTDHFSLDEFIRSDMAARLGIDNTPPQEYLPRLKALALRLEEVRSLLGCELIITSGFRCRALNGKIPGSALKSAHTLAYAADFHTHSISPYDVCKRIAASNIVYDQLIYEFAQWTHLSVDPQSRRQLLTKRSGSAYQSGLIGP